MLLRYDHKPASRFLDFTLTWFLEMTKRKCRADSKLPRIHKKISKSLQSTPGNKKLFTNKPANSHESINKESQGQSLSKGLVIVSLCCNSMTTYVRTSCLTNVTAKIKKEEFEVGGVDARPPIEPTRKERKKERRSIGDTNNKQHHNPMIITGGHHRHRTIHTLAGKGYLYWYCKSSIYF